MSGHAPEVRAITATDGSTRWIMECACGDMSARDSRPEIDSEVDWHLSRTLMAEAEDRGWAKEWDEGWARIDAQIAAMPGPRKPPVRLTARGRRVLWTLAFLLAFLAGMAVQTDRPPACQYEDEVVLFTGECHPLDDSEFTENGWEAR